jgi:serine/threonine protein kinase
VSLPCESCGEEISDFDIKCPECGHLQSSSGVQRMIGTVVLGQYEIVDVLGQGGMSVVYKGLHRLTEQEVALKLLPPEMALLSQVKSRFVEEAKALAQLDHPNIVHLYNFGEEDGSFVLAMQYVHGQTFERMITDADALEWTVACRVAVDVLRALEYAHGRGIIHRDMKPSNVLVREDDGAATVMDFGIAKITNSTRLTATGQTMGTVRYMSPEQVRGLSVDPRTDIYSLGATLYEAIYGDTPFDGDTHFEIMSKHLTEAPVSLRDRGVDVPITLDALILKSLGKKPDDRFADARQFRKEIEAVLR